MGGRFVLAVLLLAAAPLPGAMSADEVLPVPRTIEEARVRLGALGDQAGLVDRWVEENWEAEFPKRYPALSRGPKERGETDAAFREREMRGRMAVAELATRLRAERRQWLEKERLAVLSLRIGEPLPVRLGPYDRERGEYPVLLGFGWPSELEVRLRVPEREKGPFAGRFPASIPAVFRINEKGEAYLLSLDGRRMNAEPVVSVVSRGPRLLWQGAHDSWVTAVSLNPDGSQAVSGGGDGALCAWDAETGNRAWRLEDAEMALSVAHSPGGGAFATGATDSRVRMRDAATGNELWSARASGMVFSASFSPDGRFVATGDDGGTLVVWNAESGKEVLRADLGAPVLSVAYAPDGRSIAAGSEGGFVVLWEVVSGRQAWKILVDEPVYAVAASPAGNLVAAGAGGFVRAVRASDGSEAWRQKSDGDVRTIRFDPSGRLVAFGGSGYAARILAAADGAAIWGAPVGSPIRSLAFGPNGAKLLVGSADFGVRLFVVDEGNRIQAAFSAYGPIFVEREAAERLFRE